MNDKKNEPWKIIARACCPRVTHDCLHCSIRPKCTERAKTAVLNLQTMYILSPKGDFSIFTQAELRSIDEAEVIETPA